jgi:hypothetical protein
MAILNFPDNPELNDQYTGDNSTTYVFDGVKWVGNTAGGAAGTNSIQNGSFTVQIDADGNLILPSNGTITQRNSYTRVTGPNLPNGSAVVWTALYDYISSVKLIIQLEATEVGDATGWHSQACEAVIASRGYANSFSGPGGEPVMTVYGVTYTSIEPLVTFTVQRNATNKKIEIVGTTTAATTDSPQFRIHSIEIATRD